MLLITVHSLCHSKSRWFPKWLPALVFVLCLLFLCLFLLQLLICKWETMEKCFFRDALQCSEDSGSLTIAVCAWIETIIECSKVYIDDIHTVLALKLIDDPPLTIKCHRKCGSTYTSRQQIKRFLKRKGDVETEHYFPPKHEIVRMIQTSHFCSSVYFVEVIGILKN